MAEVGLYIKLNTLRGRTHLTLAENYYGNFRNPKTLCGLDLRTKSYVPGDETSTGVKSNCATCRRAYAPHRT